MKTYMFSNEFITLLKMSWKTNSPKANPNIDDSAFVLIGLKFKDILYFDQNELFEIDWANLETDEKGDLLTLSLDWLLACTWKDDGTIKWETSKSSLVSKLRCWCLWLDDDTKLLFDSFIGIWSASHEKSLKINPNVSRFNIFMVEISLNIYRIQASNWYVFVWILPKGKVKVQWR